MKVYSTVFPFISLTKDMATSKIQNFEKFIDGWHFGEGVAFSKSTLDLAIEIIMLIKKLGYGVVDAFPGTDGSLGIYTYENGKNIDIDINQQGLLKLKIEDDNSDIIFEDNISIEKLNTKLIELISGCNLYEYFLRTTGTKLEGDLIVEPSKTLHLAESQLSKLNVAYGTREILVLT